MQYRFAKVTDSRLLASMNQQLIQDENHRNPMNLAELERRMAEWLGGHYQAVVFEEENLACGYALFRDEPEHIYLRHFYVDRNHRRRGIGRAAVGWLCRHVWNDDRRIRVDVLVGNEAGIAFWKSVGFGEYSLALEKEASKGCMIKGWN